MGAGLLLGSRRGGGKMPTPLAAPVIKPQPKEKLPVEEKDLTEGEDVQEVQTTQVRKQPKVKSTSDLRLTNLSMGTGDRSPIPNLTKPSGGTP
tara:strand:+ start:472 stop:750 length:279 start_codon:yes stop_codon:yes gene_type:complete